MGSILLGGIGMADPPLIINAGGGRFYYSMEGGANKTRRQAREPDGVQQFAGARSKIGLRPA
jgi:hypothetical protein